MSERPGSRPHAERRRRRFYAASATLLLALTAACVFAVVIASQLGVRLDTTALGAHSLAPATRAAVDRIGRPAEVLVLGRVAQLPPAARAALTDTLEALGAASPRLDVTVIDPLAPGAAAASEAMVRRLLDRQPERAADHAGRLTRAAEGAIGLAASLRSLAARVPAAGATLDLLADELETAAETLPSVALLPLGRETIASLPRARQSLGPVLERVAGALRSMGPDAPPALLEDATSVERALDPPWPLNAAAAAELLATSECVIAADDRRLAAIGFADLFRLAPGSAEPEFVGEDLLASALLALGSDRRPVVVFVHGERSSVLDAAGAPTPGARAVLGDLLERFRLRQFRLGEWAPALDRPMPTPAELDAGPDDPVVWFVLGPPAAGAPDSASRLRKLAAAVERIVARGHSALVTLGPSDLPALGEPDPLSQALRPLGLAPDTGRVVVERTQTPTGPVVRAEHVSAAADTAHPAGALIDGLSLLLRLPTPIRIDEAEGVRTWPIVSIEGGDDVWAESRWQALGSPRAAISPPTPDPREDTTRGPFVPVAAAERAGDGPGVAAQRVVVVGSPLWFADAVTRASAPVDGRLAPRFPANAELAIGSTLWLAGQESLIATGAEARRAPRIGSISPGRLAAVRWSLALGMPLAVLLAGAAVALGRRSHPHARVQWRG
jgi:hypothetical protein